MAQYGELCNKFPVHILIAQFSPDSLSLCLFIWRGNKYLDASLSTHSSGLVLLYNFKQYPQSTEAHSYPPWFCKLQSRTALSLAKRSFTYTGLPPSLNTLNTFQLLAMISYILFITGPPTILFIFIISVMSWEGEEIKTCTKIYLRCMYILNRRWPSHFKVQRTWL